MKFTGTPAQLSVCELLLFLLVLNFSIYKKYIKATLFVKQHIPAYLCFAKKALVKKRLKITALAY